MEFDQHAANYHQTLDRSLSAFGETSEYFARLKADLLLQYTDTVLGTPRALTCLDVGCGTGVTLQFLASSFSTAAGSDVSAAMLAEAQNRLPDVGFTPCVPGQPLPYADRSFDVVYTCCTMHHVPPPDLPRFVSEMVRVTRPGGLVYTFEHNPYNPLTRAVVRGCEFDQDAILVPPPEARRLFTQAGLEKLHLWYYIFFPKSLGFMRGLERCLGTVPLGGQYFLAGRPGGLMLLSLVIPLYNEEAVARAVASAVLDAFRSSGEALELVLVDNGSSDGTGRIIDVLATEAPEVRKVRVDLNQGYGWGVICGLQAATGTHLGYMAGDGQITPPDVLSVWRRLQVGDCDVCKTCRIRREDGPIRQVVTFFCNHIFPLFFPVGTRDINGTPKMMSRALYETLHLESKDWFLDAEIMIKSGRRGLKVAEVPVTFHARAGGMSHVRWSSITEFLGNIVRAWWKGMR